jgi:hypothetical protein
MHEDAYECLLVATHEHRVRWNGDRCAVPDSLCRSNNGLLVRAKVRVDGNLARTADNRFQAFLPAVQFPVG